VEAPAITVAVLVEHGGHGGSAAAPIAQRVLARWFEKQQAAAGERVASQPGAPGERVAAAGGDRADD
jgi:penicillin-binding protein 2